MSLSLWKPTIPCNNLSVADVRTLTPALRDAHDKARAGGVTVPTTVSNSLRRLEAAAAVFDGDAPDAPPAPNAPAPDPNAARSTLAGMWRAVHTQLGVWAKVDEATGATGAAALRDAVFGTSKPLGFMSGKVRAVWLRSGEVLDALREKGGEALFEARGGGALFAQLVTAQEASGRSFGIKGSLRPKAARVNQRDALRGASLAVCDYAARVQAMACPDCPGTDAVAARLLAPLDAVAPVRKGGRGRKASPKGADDARKALPLMATKTPEAPKAPDAAPANDAAPHDIAV